jgi:hypothetical protein
MQFESITEQAMDTKNIEKQLEDHNQNRKSSVHSMG